MVGYQVVVNGINSSVNLFGTGFKKGSGMDQVVSYVIDEGIQMPFVQKFLSEYSGDCYALRSDFTTKLNSIEFVKIIKNSDALSRYDVSINFYSEHYGHIIVSNDFGKIAIISVYVKYLNDQGYIDYDYDRVKPSFSNEAVSNLSKECMFAVYYVGNFGTISDLQKELHNKIVTEKTPKVIWNYLVRHHLLWNGIRVDGPPIFTVVSIPSYGPPVAGILYGLAYTAQDPRRTHCSAVPRII